MVLHNRSWLLGVIALALGCGAAPSEPAAPAPSPAPPAGAVESPEADAEQPADTSPTSGPIGSAPEDAKAPDPAPAPADPYADMPHPPDSDSGRHQLAAEDVKQTVQTYRPHMRELCWVPRVNKTLGGKAKARVAIEVEVSKDGTVKSVRAVGGNDYEGLADCVSEHVKRWHFPRAKQSSSLMFPILFERGEATLIRVD